MEKKSNKGLVAALIIVGCIFGAFVIAVTATIAVGVFYPLMEYRGEVKPTIVKHDPEPDSDPGTKKYATDYPITNGQTVHRVYDKWTVKKNKSDGVCYLYIWNPGQKEEYIDHLRFTVYDTAEDARESYEDIYDIYREYSQRVGGYGWDEGKNWFTSEEPDVCDASIVEIVCVEDNVLIFADIEVTGEWGTWDNTDETTMTSASSAPVFDRSVLKGYVIGNSAQIRDYIVNTVLYGQEPEIEGTEVQDGYIAVLRGGAGERTYETYVYEMAVGYRYINTTSTTESWGSTRWNTVVDSYGYLNTKGEIVEVARDHNSCSFVTYPGDSRTYSIEDFMND